MDNDRFSHDSMRFTASVMGNPEYLNAVREIKPAKDERHVGIDRLNAFHAKRTKKETDGSR